jgi:uncharacterized protein YdhG (YjbR/CyaY superfamily)
MAGPASVEAYLASLDPAQRRSVEALRAAILAAVPTATETISYGIPTVRVDGRMLLSYAAYRTHLGIYPASRVVLAALGDDLAPYLSGKATIRLPSEEPIPSSLVERIVRARVDELSAR